MIRVKASLWKICKKVQCRAKFLAPNKYIACLSTDKNLRSMYFNFRKSISIQFIIDYLLRHGRHRYHLEEIHKKKLLTGKFQLALKI